MNSCSFFVLLEGSDNIKGLCLNQAIKTTNKIVLTSILSLSFLLFAFCTPAFAGTAGSVQSSVNEILPMLKAISVFFNSLCVLGMGIGIMQMVLSRDQRMAQGAVKFMKMVIFAFIIFNCLGAIVTYVDSLGIANFYSFSDHDLSSIVHNYTTTTKTT